MDDDEIDRAPEPDPAIARADLARRLLGLAPRDELVSFAAFTRAAGAGRPARTGWARLAAEDALLAAACDEAGIAIAASDDDGALVELDAPRGALRWDGRVREDASHHLAIDAREAPAVVQVVTATLELALVVGRDGAFGARVTRRLDLRPRASSRPETPTPPDVDALLADRDAPAWAREAATALASSASPLDRVAAVGLCARLPRLDPGDDDDEHAAPAAEIPAIAVGRAWPSGLDAPAVARVEALALARVDALDDALAHFAEAARAGALAGEARDRAALHLWHERDDLESAALVLRVLDRHELVSRSLAALDARVTTGDASRDLAAAAASDARLATLAPPAWAALRAQST